MPDDTPSEPRRIIADLRRELVELRQQLNERAAQLDDALSRETATAEVLGIINSSPGDLKPVFDAMLEKALRLCEAAMGTLWVYQGDSMRAVTSLGGMPALLEFLQRERTRPIIGWPDHLLGGKHFAQTADITSTEGYHSGDPFVRAAADLGEIRTVLLLPLHKEETVLGHFGIYRQEPRPFTEKQIALLQNFAAQAVIAMENARLLTETRETLEQQTATAEVLGVIKSSPGDLAQVFGAMLERVTRLCEPSFATMFTWNGTHLIRVALRGPAPPEFSKTLGVPVLTNPDGPGGRIVAGEDIVSITDFASDPRVRNVPALRALVQFGGRSYLAVALRKEGRLLGMIAIYRLEVRPFTESEIELVRTFADQAVIAMENARLITETREALAQQTATAEVLGVINSSPGDLAPVFDAMLERALRLCGGSFGVFVIYQGEHYRVAANRGLPPELAQFVEAPIAIEPGSMPDRLRRGGEVIQIPDIAALDAEHRTPGLVAMIELGRARTALWVALRKDGVAQGFFGVYRQEVRPFADKQIALLQNFAAQAVIAMENARLITETREALEQQTATAEVLGVINASPGDLTPVFDAILEKAHSLCGAVDGTLMLRDGEHFRLAAIRGPTSDALAERLQQGFLGSDAPASKSLLAGERFVHIHDVASVDHPITQAAFKGGTRTLLSVPLRKGNELLGMIVGARKEVRPFTDKQIALLRNFAAQAVIAMENARLLGELRERNEEIAGFNKALEARVAAQLAELEQTGKLRRFLAPQLADLIVAQGNEAILESHRREIVVVFCDLRGFTAFAERAEPEEVMALLKEYHATLGPIVARFEGTLDHYSGDGIMVFFNDPLPTPDPARRAIEMAVAMREAAQGLLRMWRRQGHDLGFGVGISQGYATLGQIGFAERMDYTAIGTVTNLAARLCAEAKNGQILVSARIAATVEDSAKFEEIGDLALKGLSQAVAVFNVVER